MAKKHERTHARRAALALLYTSEITDKATVSLVEEGPLLEEGGALTEYAEALVRGVEEHRDAIDEQLAAASENWALSRMPIVDRSVLRLAVYEMTYVDDVPTSVTINEAIELAKDFGGEDESHRFVNGVLGRIAKRLEADLSPCASEDASDSSAGGAAANDDAADDADAHPVPCAAARSAGGSGDAPAAQPEEAAGRAPFEAAHE